jgi:hypothetical protein
MKQSILLILDYVAYFLRKLFRKKKKKKGVSQDETKKS